MKNIKNGIIDLIESNRQSGSTTELAKAWLCRIDKKAKLIVNNFVMKQHVIFILQQSELWQDKFANNIFTLDQLSRQAHRGCHKGPLFIGYRGRKVNDL